MFPAENFTITESLFPNFLLVQKHLSLADFPPVQQSLTSRTEIQQCRLSTTGNFLTVSTVSPSIIPHKKNSSQVVNLQCRILLPESLAE